MKRTSRRTFGKQLTGAIAALPVVSMGASAGGQTKRTATRQGEYEIFYHQTTPPPLLIEDGSLSFSFRTATPARPLNETPTGNNFTYSGNVFGIGRNKIHHIRVLHGSGRMLYDDAGLTISVEVQEGGPRKIGQIEIKSTADLVTIESIPFATGRAQLQHSVTGLNTKRHRFLHQGSGANDFRISSITVTKADGSSQSFLAPREDPEQPFSQEYRIMVWFE